MNEVVEQLALEDHIDSSIAAAKAVPELIKVLRGLHPIYRQRAIDAAMCLLQDIIP